MKCCATFVPNLTEHNKASDKAWKKSQISREFQGQICGKIGLFCGNFQGKFLQKAILVKNGQFCGYFQGKFRYKSINSVLTRQAF